MLAKTTRPSTSGISPPARLIHRLDQACRRPLVWLEGPAGCGKTTLVSCYVDRTALPCLWYQVDEGDNDLASFFYFLGQAAKRLTPRRRIPLPLLTPEYAPGVEVFASQFFEKLFRRLPSSAILVFDDYHRLPASAPLHAILRQCLTSVPEEITSVFISRDQPPAALARLRPDRQTTKIYGEELFFTVEETEALLESLAQKKFPSAFIRDIHDKTGGWAAGLVLLAERGEKDGWQIPTVSSLGCGEVFDFFAGEIFGEADADEREFLLKTSLFPKMTARMAALLTGHHCADLHLERFHRRHFFTERFPKAEIEYRYHPLFRDFLLARARQFFDRKAWQRLAGQAATILDDAGWIEDAANLYIQAGDPAGLLRLVSANADSLFGQGRHHLVKEWLTAMPAESGRQEPRLLFWLGICLQPFNPATARRHLQQAFFLFKDHDREAALLAWSAVVDTIRNQWDDFKPLDRWIAIFNEVHTLDGPPMPTEVEGRVATSLATALTIREPQHPDLESWLARSLACARKIPDNSFRILCYSQAVLYFFWAGDFKQGMVVFEEIRHLARDTSATPMIRLAWIWLEAAIDIWLATANEEVGDKVERGLAYGNRHGVYVWHHMLLSVGAYNCLAREDTNGAEQYLKQLAMILDGTRRHMYCQYHYLLCWLYLLKNEHTEALAHAEESCRVAEETGYVYPEILCRLALGRVLLALERTGPAAELGTAMLAKSRRSSSRLFEYSSMLLLAEAAFAKGEETEGAAWLGKALLLAAGQGYTSPPWWWDRAAMGRLYVKALEHGIETDHVRKSIRQRRLTPEDPPLHLENWPWPIRISTLGCFKLERDDQPVLFNGKVQKKPLELLQLLAASGGREISGEAATRTLWPDADGDAAHRSLKTTLHRLRLLLGGNDLILFQNGRLTLNPRMIWLDALAFEQLLAQAEKLWNAPGSPDAAARLTVRALDLYGGPFLSQVEDESWSIAAREKLRQKFMRGVLLSGRHLEERQRLDDALDLYRRAIETEPLVEEFYQRRMICLRAAGRRAEAMRVYDQCCSVLDTAFGVEPSSTTREIRQQL